ncbi:PREDICTED: fibrinogen C domain-containing protein 1-like [Branchiostoma belcheri]|uniref:Fibrinogen C domain-containing protein 1-like n=1 Tax=Branchiostoma belcheri TaxID=7741 RepID=A0A6P5AA72_BRABE|nr:PREDICTED: fibrinogen C domain-containing protein 1-like [Branchiostoma belcheri]
MEGSVTNAINGAKDMWILTFKESEGDMETSILLDNFDPAVDELPDAYDLGDLSAFGAYSQRYLQMFSYRYMEMRQSVSLRAIFPDCGTAVYSLRLNERFTLRRIPFFLLACWEIEFTEFIIVPVPCFEIVTICGIRVVIPVIKVIIIRRTYWFGVWVFIPLPANCPPQPAPGFGAVRVRCGRLRIFRPWNWIKDVCVYTCLPGWNRWTGSYVRWCRNVKPCDCKEIHDMDPTLPSGIYMIYPRDNQPGFLVYCDMETDGGGWTVFQRRQDGSVDFYRGWDDYKRGFPSDNMTGEFWLGNDKIHRLTVQPRKDYALRVDMEANNGTTAYAEYNWFGLANEANNYRAVISGYSGTAGDSMLSTTAGLSLNGMDFSTYDDDNDNLADGSCAVRFHGAWWYNACGESNLNGMYGSEEYEKGLVWKTFRGLRESLKFTEMKVRPLTETP